jgi:hypothetical protein
MQVVNISTLYCANVLTHIRVISQYMSFMQPADYEPPFFRGCTEEEANHPWVKNPLKMEVGNVNSKHFVLALKVMEGYPAHSHVLNTFLMF